MNILLDFEGTFSFSVILCNARCCHFDRSHISRLESHEFWGTGISYPYLGFSSTRKEWKGLSNLHRLCGIRFWNMPTSMRLGEAGHGLGSGMLSCRKLGLIWDNRQIVCCSIVSCSLYQPTKDEGCQLCFWRELLTSRCCSVDIWNTGILCYSSSALSSWGNWTPDILSTSRHQSQRICSCRLC